MPDPFQTAFPLHLDSDCLVPGPKLPTLHEWLLLVFSLVWPAHREEEGTTDRQASHSDSVVTTPRLDATSTVPV